MCAARIAETTIRDERATTRNYRLVVDADHDDAAVDRYGCDYRATSGGGGLASGSASRCTGASSGMRSGALFAARKTLKARGFRGLPRGTLKPTRGMRRLG